MKLTQILGRTWVLEGAEHMGLYRLDGGRCILLDSGQQFERQDLADTLAGAGLTPVGVLSSHIHTDHSINNGWLRTVYGCRTAAPAGEIHLCRSPAALHQYMAFYSPGTIARELGDMVSPVDCPIPAGDGIFSFCGADFSILHTPGHSIDHISILTPDNICYTGDAVLFRSGLKAKLPYGYDLASMIASTRLVETLACGGFIACHQGCGDCGELHEAARQTRALLLGRAEEIRGLISRPMTWQEILQAVNSHFSLFSARPMHTLRLERNLRSFLDYLLDTGVLTCQARLGMTYFSPACAAAEEGAY